MTITRCSNKLKAASAEALFAKHAFGKEMIFDETAAIRLPDRPGIGVRLQSKI